MVKILIVEDDVNLQFLLQKQLEVKYQIYTANNAKQAIAVIENKHINLLITDIMMPGMDGVSLVKYLRKEDYTFPILILTAKHTIKDKTLGFHAGTDDYLTKPVDYEELLLRIEALLRRAKIASSNELVIGQTSINQANYTIKNEQYQITLVKKEFDLLFKLLSYPGQIFTKEQLLDEIWGFDSFSSEDTIKTHISKLRKNCQNFTDFKIVTVKGLGYKGEIVNG